jgi:cytochrome oxidase Cu insertion factor (SCO1/SenC/PrrC family)
MWKFIVNINWLVTLGLLLTACGTTPTATVAPAPVQTSPQAGDKAPDFTLTDSAGNRMNLATVVTEHKSAVLVFYLSHT